MNDRHKAEISIRHEARFMSHPLPTKFKSLPPIDRLFEVLRYEPQTGRIYFTGKGGYARCRADVTRAGSGYRFINFSKTEGGAFAAHRIAFKMLNGADPVGVVDHINGIRDDNREGNLRDVSAAANAANHHGRLWRDTLKARAYWEAVSRKRAGVERRARLTAAIDGLLSACG